MDSELPREQPTNDASQELAAGSLASQQSSRESRGVTGEASSQSRVIAVLHVHGMGEQARYSGIAETSSAIVQALTEDVYAHPCSLKGVVADDKDLGHDENVIATNLTCNCTAAQLADAQRQAPASLDKKEEKRQPHPWEPAGAIGKWTLKEDDSDQVQIYRVDNEIHKKHVLRFTPLKTGATSDLEIHVMETYWAPLATGVIFWYTFAWLHKVWLALFRNIWPLSRPLKIASANGVNPTLKFSWNIESCKRVLKLLSTMYILIITATAFILYGVISSGSFIEQLKSLRPEAIASFLTSIDYSIPFLFMNSFHIGTTGVSSIVIMIALLALVITSNVVNSPLPYQAFKMIRNGRRLLFPSVGIYIYVGLDLLWHCSIWHTWWRQFSTSSWWIDILARIPLVGTKSSAIVSIVWEWMCHPFSTAARSICLQQTADGYTTIPYANFILPITNNGSFPARLEFHNTFSGEAFAASLIFVTFFIHFSFWLKLFKMQRTKQHPNHICMLLLYFTVASAVGVWAFSTGMMLPAPFFLFYLGFYLLSWRWLNYWLAHWFGDVALFTNQNENSPLYQRRQEIVQCMVKQLDYVFSASTTSKGVSGDPDQAQPEPIYQEVIIYGHSLGCLVSYYGLCEYFRRMFESGNRAQFKDVTDRLKAFVTTGCHLDIVEYLFDPGSTENRYYDTLRAFGRYAKPPALASGVQPDDWQPLRAVCWVNIWHWWDVFSSKLFQYGDVINARVSGSIPLLCHSYYMQIRRVRGLLKHVLLMPRLDNAEPAVPIEPPLQPLALRLSEATLGLKPDTTAPTPAFKPPQPLIQPSSSADLALHASDGASS